MWQLSEIRLHANRKQAFKIVRGLWGVIVEGVAGGPQSSHATTSKDKNLAEFELLATTQLKL